MTLLLTLIAVEVGTFIILYRKTLPRKNRTHFITVRFATDSNVKGVHKMADLILKVGQSSIGTVVPLEADGVTVTAGAAVSNIVWTLSDPAVTVVTNPDNSVKITGDAATTADLTGTVSATVTDSDGTTQNFSASFTVSVGAVTPPTNRTASLGVRFSVPS